MSSVRLPAKGVDYSFSRPNIDVLWNQGYRFVGRYLTGSGKALTTSEANNLRHKGFHIQLFYETTATRALGGHNAGLEDARSAASACRSLGVPQNIVVYFTVDFDPVASQTNTIASYLQGAQQELNKLHYHSGVYGGIQTMHIAERAGIKFYCQTIAWSGGKWANVHVRQTKVNLRIAGGDCDELIALKPFGGWS